MIGDVVKAAKSALIVEQGRLQKFKEIDEKNREIHINFVQVLLTGLQVYVKNFKICCS